MRAINVLLILGVVSVSSLAWADSYHDGRKFGKKAMNDEFSLGRDCNRLSDTYNFALQKCNFPNPKFNNGCQDGVKVAYERIQWTECKPSFDECMNFGFSAAEMVVDTICEGATHASVYQAKHACFMLAKDACHLDVYGLLFNKISNNNCSQVREMPDYDDQLVQDMRNRCDDMLRSMIGVD